VSGVPGYRLQRVAISSEAVAGPDPVELLLGPLRDDSAAARPDLVVAVHPSAQVGAPAAAGVLFRHGDVVVAPEAGALAVRSPRASFSVALDGSGLRGTYAPPADRQALELLANVELFVALTSALHARGLYHLHAAALVAPAGEVLLVAGTASCGKSTLATALVAAGCAYLGDDVVFVTRGEGGVSLAGFPRAFHLAEASARAVPATLSHVLAGAPTYAGKRWLDPGAAFPGAARRSAGAPALLLFPEIVDTGTTRAAPLERAEALGRLLASSLFAMTRLGSPAQRALLAEVVAGASPHGVQLGRDLLRDAIGAAARLLDAVGAGAAR
jgi:hypothetical protein